MKKVKQWIVPKRKPISTKTFISDWEAVGNDMRKVLEDFEGILKYK